MAAWPLPAVSAAQLSEPCAAFQRGGLKAPPHLVVKVCAASAAGPLCIMHLSSAIWCEREWPLR